MSRGPRHLAAALQRASAGTVLIVVTLVGMALVSLVSARQLTRAAEARREAADAAIREYAAYSARMFAEGAYRAFESVRLRTLTPILGTDIARNRPLPTLQAFKANVTRELRQSGIPTGDSVVGFFIAHPGTGAFEGVGAVADSVTAARLIQALRAAPETRTARLTSTRFVTLDAPALSAAFIRVSSDRGDSALYGFTVDRTVWFTAIGDAVTRQLPLLPASFVDPTWRYLTDPQRMDTLIAISVSDARGRVHYQSRAPFPTRLSGEFNALNGPAAFRVVATLHPAMDTLLRHETRQAETVDPALGALLPPLALFFVIVAAAQLWRQRNLARARRTFVATVSHELRTPLAQIRLYIETLLLGRAETEAEKRSWLDIVARETRKLGAIVDNILLFSHLDAGRARLEKETTDLGELVEEVVESFVPLARSRDMRLVADAPSRIIASVDPRALRQIVANLLENALKYGPAGQTVSVELERVGRLARLSIRDEGPGIPASRRRRIWQPFGTVRIGDGTGIGLAVVRGLVREHGGRLLVDDNEVGRGACFSVELPVLEPAMPAATHAPNEYPSAAPRLSRMQRRLWQMDAGSLGLSAVLLAITGLSLVAAWSLRSAWVRQQESTDHGIREYAAFGARLFYDRSFGVFESLRLRALAPAMGRSAAGTPLPLADLRRSAQQQLLLSGVALSSDVGFFRLDPVSGAYEGIDAAADLALGPAIQRAVQEAEALAIPPNEPVRWMVLFDRTPHLSLGYVMQESALGAPRAAYGLIAPRVRLWDAVGRTALRELQLLPPSLTSPDWRWLVDQARSDSVVAVTMTDTEGRVFFTSRAPFPESPVGEFDTRNIPGGALISATLHPHLVTRMRERFNAPQRAVTHLAIGGIDAPVRLDALIAVMSLLLLGAVVFQLKREYSLARARRDFIASVSHELRTPLAQMRMFAETLQLGRERDAEERLRWLNVVGRETRRLGDLVENILLFSHLGADVSKLEKERTDLGELVEEIVEAYVPVFMERGARIIADAPSRIFVLVDPRAMRQVIVNLLDNALKYGPKGQTVRIAVERVDGVAQLSVQDQGPGIAPDDRRRIWEPFVRLGRYAGTTAGSGIGLSVVRGLVERHGGTIAVEDAPGGGARFVVTLEISESAAGLPLRATGEWSVRGR